ncbi:MAG: butyrate kinase [Spirochaetales bacterium]|nr:butyrate kinase [Spirochaetales bacterium]
MQILVINPGSTSTKVAVYDRQSELFRVAVTHDVRELARFPRVADQLPFRVQVVLQALRARSEYRPDEIRAVVGRGGLLHPLEGGVYAVNEAMKADLRAARYGSHASNLGGLIADSLARELGVSAFVADPVVVDELEPLARYTGLPEISRKSIFHALNQRATAKRAAQELGKRYDRCTLIVAHLGGGTSVGIHVNGRVVDVNNALDGDGPFSIERAGCLPPGEWLRYVVSHGEDARQLQRKLTGQGGIVAHLGVNDARELEAAIGRYEAGRPAEGGLDGARCLGVLRALCYQTAKEVCSLAAVAAGRVDAVVLTGGLAHMQRVVREISARVSFLAPVLVFPGENEMGALAAAALEVLEDRETAREYTP